MYETNERHAAGINRPSELPKVACSRRVRLAQRENELEARHGKCSVIRIADKLLVAVSCRRVPPIIGVRMLDKTSVQNGV